MSKTKIIIGAAILLIVIGLVWAFRESTKPLPGEGFLQDGRDHKPQGSKLEYKFNPPTSGDHYPSWITKGFYDTPRLDGNLVHSQEHGYIIIWYDCTKPLANSWQLIKDVYAQSDQSLVSRTPMTQGSEGSPSASLEQMPEQFRNGSCDNTKKQLKEVFSQFGPHKLIIVPRVGMDKPIVLTAWGRMLKLDKIDKDQIQKFIDFFRDRGPEDTNEP